ncbi:MAG: hypothetical protein NVS2B4_19230 [Ramlibacter sp.]
MPSNVLILGASYGSLLATKLLMAGHAVTLVCTRDTADLINKDGTLVRFPLKGRSELVDVNSRKLHGTLKAATPQEVDPKCYDLVVLGMQEAQYGGDGVRPLMGRIAASGKPCLAIMNMPPLPYLQRVPGLDARALRSCYTDPAVWDGFDARLVSLASPDPQAFRPPDQPKNVLQVGLPTNFKAARFDDQAHNGLLRQLEADIDQARFCVGGESLEMPVKLKVHDSVFVPLAKWPMLVTGNYRCIQADQMIAIRDAVHGDIDLSRKVYQWVVDLCTRLGAEPGDLVPFDKYAQAASSLLKPSSAARSLFGGARQIERVDMLVQLIARQLGQPSTYVDETVRLVNARLERNRAAA